MKDSTTRRWAGGAFPGTCATDVAAASQRDPEARREPLGWIYESYRRPLYRFLRHEGLDHERAKDLVHGVFALIWRTNALAGWRPSVGKFRTFLLGITKRHLADELRSLARKRRSPPRRLRSLTGPDGEEIEVPAKGKSAEELYDQGVLLEMIVIGRRDWKEALRGEGRLEEVRVIEAWEESEDPAEPDYAALGEAAGVTKQQAWHALNRLFTRLREKRATIEAYMKGHHGDEIQARKDTRRMFRPGGVLGGGTKRRKKPKDAGQA